jgi:superfamily I DNA/RNA helicase
LSEFAVLYTKRSLAGGETSSAPEMIMTTLESGGIMCQWVSEDYRAKRGYDITTDKVSISTIHSAKGLDYACVFLLGLDGLPPDGWSEAQIRKLVYVGITRARHRLVIPYIDRTLLIAELISCL